MKKIFFIYPIFLFGFIGEIFSSTGKICIDPDATVTILMTTYDGTFDEHTLMQSPTIVNNSVTVFEGDLNTVLSTADLSSTDTDSNFTALGYTVGNVTNGTLTINGSAWASGSNDTFIQQDIIDGNILYSHNDSNTTSDSFSFSVSDGTNTLDFQIFNISIENVLSVV